jgi:hypothetical protein
LEHIEGLLGMSPDVPSKIINNPVGGKKRDDSALARLPVYLT